MENKITCTDVFGKRLKELRKANGYTIEQFAEKVGIAKSSVGYYENAKRLPDVEILTRIADALNVSADYLIGRTNTAAQKGKMKTVCDFTGLSDNAAEYLVHLVKDRDYEKLSVINHLFQELINDYAFYDHEENGGEETAGSVLGAMFLYFARFSGWDSELEDYFDLGDEKQRKMLAAAYRQAFLNQITDAVKASAESFKQMNKPWE